MVVAYYNGNVVKGLWTVVYCDACAGWQPDDTLKPTGLVPFSETGLGPFGSMVQDAPWCWANWKVGKPCDGCGKEI